MDSTYPGRGSVKEVLKNMMFSMFGNSFVIDGVCYRFEKGGVEVCTYDIFLSDPEDSDEGVRNDNNSIMCKNR